MTSPVSGGSSPYDPSNQSLSSLEMQDKIQSQSLEVQNNFLTNICNAADSANAEANETALNNLDNATMNIDCSNMTENQYQQIMEQLNNLTADGTNVTADQVNAAATAINNITATHQG